MQETSGSLESFPGDPDPLLSSDPDHLLCSIQDHLLRSDPVKAYETPIASCAFTFSPISISTYSVNLVSSKYSARAGSADKAQFTEFLRSQGWPFARNRIIIDGCERTS
jgi:hypothetical protein